MNDHDKIQEILLKLPFVKWDRFTLDGESRDVKMYGWIDREKDAYRDFILVSFEEGEVVGFTTSSAKYTHEINKILGFYDDEHSECMRVDESFPEVKNATHLKTQPDIEREFDEKFHTPNAGDAWGDMTNVKDFVRANYISRSALKETLTKLRKELRDKHKNDGWADHELPDVHYNSALDDLSKELSLDV